MQPSVAAKKAQRQELINFKNSDIIYFIIWQYYFLIVQAIM